MIPISNEPIYFDADEPLRTRMLQLAGEVAAAKEQGARTAPERKRLPTHS